MKAHKICIIFLTYNSDFHIKLGIFMMFKCCKYNIILFHPVAHHLLTNVTDTHLTYNTVYETLKLVWKSCFLFITCFSASLCFDLYGHHQMLKQLWGRNCCALCLVLFFMVSHLCASVSHSNRPFPLCVACVLLLLHGKLHWFFLL